MFAPDIPKAHDRKPDAAEPWRFVCPQCRGQVQGSQRHTRYRCVSCDRSWCADELFDKRLRE